MAVNDTSRDLRLRSAAWKQIGTFRYVTAAFFSLQGEGRRRESPKGAECHGADPPWYARPGLITRDGNRRLLSSDANYTRHAAPGRRVFELRIFVARPSNLFYNRGDDFVNAKVAGSVCTKLQLMTKHLINLPLLRYWMQCCVTSRSS